MMFVVHQDSVKKANITSKMDELNLYLEQAVRQFHKERHRKQVYQATTTHIATAAVYLPVLGQMYHSRNDGSLVV